MRILHAMLRVTDLDAALHFYEHALGMTPQRRHDYPDARFTRVVVAHGAAPAQAAIELTHNWDRHGYTHGDAFGYLALAVDDAAAVCARVRAHGGTVTREAGPMKHGNNVIAFVQDPDGYRIELIEESACYD
jgi:lactoylglutathione lyase